MTQSNAVTRRVEEIPQRYIAAWDEPDAESRRRAIAGLWTEDGTYTDPLAAAEGRQAIEGVITGVREQFPGHTFRLLGNADTHHNVVRFRWELVPEESDESVVEGFDVAVVADDGRVRDVYGFLDKVPGA